MKEMELIERQELFPPWVLYVLLATIIWISIIKYRHEIVYVHLRSAFFKSPASTLLSKEEISFFGKTNWTLLFNYFITTGLVIYMVLVYYQENDYWLVILPIVYYCLQILELFFVGIISGELKKIQSCILLTNYTSHIIGIIFIPILLIWMLNPHLPTFLIYCFVIIFVFLQLIRIIRGILSAFHNKILWYYIILYLCTFEIWPIIIIYMFLSSSFAS